MTPFRVLVATTKGPSEVLRLTPEDQDLQSVVCVSGEMKALPISTDYHDFVRNPTGVIEKLVGHPAFLADVSAPITDGNSWQLGLLIAHLLHHRGRLSHDAPLIWATGKVDRDLVLHPVPGIAEKIRSSAGVFAKARAAGIPVHLVVAKDNLADLEQALGDDRAGLHLHAPATLSDLDGLLGAVAQKRRPRRMPALLMLLVVLIVSVGVMGQSAFDWLALKRDGRYLELMAALDTAEASGTWGDRIALTMFGLIDRPPLPAPEPKLDFSILLKPRFGSCPTTAAPLKGQAVALTENRLDLRGRAVCFLKISTDPAGAAFVTLLSATLDGQSVTGEAEILLPLHPPGSGGERVVTIAALRINPSLAERRPAEDLLEHSPALLSLAGGSHVVKRLTLTGESPNPVKSYKFN